MSASWAIYDRLLAEIPEDATVRACLVGYNWTVVDSGWVGIAMTHRGRAGANSLPPPHTERSLKDLAGYLKSWDLFEASLGTAAINSYLNTPERLQTWLSPSLDTLQGAGALTDMLESVRGKKVAVIGHFPNTKTLAEECDLLVLEREPQGEDLPDCAAEYVLPQQDFVFITGATLTNKTLPRLLELSAGATVVLMGPSVPLVPWWFEQGVDVLAGMVVVDPERVWRYCQEGGVKGPFKDGGLMLQITREDLLQEPTPVLDVYPSGKEG